MRVCEIPRKCSIGGLLSYLDNLCIVESRKKVVKDRKIKGLKDFKKHKK
jgi:hypothetical protein